jgi:adenine-specific DNA methylase
VARTSISPATGSRQGWKERARDNVAAIRLAAEIEADERPATAEEQAQLIRFTGFGASDLANGVFRRPGEIDFRKGWDEIGTDLEDAVGEGDYARSPAAPSTPILRRSSSSGRSGRA